MESMTIYRINETDRTIEVAQSVPFDDESIHSAVLNARMFTFDELMNQHLVFCQNTDIFEEFRDRLHSALRVGRSIEVSTEDMVGRFIAEHGENLFFRGFVTGAIALYDAQRQQLLKPNDVVIARINRSKIHVEISERINTFFEETLSLMKQSGYFDCSAVIEKFTVQTGRTVIASDAYTFHVFHESDHAMLILLAELGQIVHRRKWTICKCGFCGKLFLDTADHACCHSGACMDAQKVQKEAVFKEHTQEYSKVKANYDSYVRRYNGYLKAVHMPERFPEEYDVFYQEMKRRQADMGNLKKKLIRNGLPVTELMDLGEQYKREIRTLAEEMLERHDFELSQVMKVKNKR